MSGILQSTMQLRSQALAVLLDSPAYAQLRALDEAVVAMGGKTILDSLTVTGKSNPPSPSRSNDDASSARAPSNLGALLQHSNRGRGIPHARAAHIALERAGHPMQSHELLEAARNEGAVIGGDKPVVNLTSTLSRNETFVNVRINGVPYWWLADHPVPHLWELSVNDQVQSSIFGDAKEEGGDGDGAALDDIIG